MESTESATEPRRALSVAEAAAAAGVSQQALRKRFGRAGAIHRRVVGGRVLAVVDADELERLYPAARQVGQPPAPEGAPTTDRNQRPTVDAGGAPAAVHLASQIEELRRQLEAERIARARLEGELAVSAKVEAAAQRYADRVEAQLEDARREALTLARALGQTERERDGARALLGARRGILARLFSSRA